MNNLDPSMPLSRILAHLGEWLTRSRERALLVMLGEYALKDIGLSRADAWNEARKPFWRA